MEKYFFKTLMFFSILLIIYAILKVVYNIWWRPLYLGQLLRRQGIRGTSYKLLRGDMEEIKRSMMEARSKPMSLNHHSMPRVFPFFYDMMQKYGAIVVYNRKQHEKLISLKHCCVFKRISIYLCINISIPIWFFYI